MADIATGAGVSSGALYSHFDSKTELLAEALRAHGSIELASLFLDDPERSVIDLLVTVGRGLVERSPHHGALVVEALVAARRDGEVAAMMGGDLRRRDRWLAGLVREGQAEGTVDPDLAPGAVSRYCLMLLLSSILLPAAGLPPIDSDDWAALIDRMGRGAATEEPHECTSTSRSARATGGATASPRSCSSPMRSATASRSATAPCPPGSRTPPARRPSTARSGPSPSRRCVSTDDRFAGSFERVAERPVGVANEIIGGPVSDWATDFDPRSTSGPTTRTPSSRTCASAARRPPDRYGALAAHTTRSAVAYDTGRFTSRSIVMGNFRPPREIAPIGGAPHLVRSAVPPRRGGCCCPRSLPRSSPGSSPAHGRTARAARGAGGPRRRGRRGRCRLYIPVRVIADMLGFPEDADLFKGFVHDVLEGVNERSSRSANMQGLFGYLMDQINDHVAHPRDDLTTFLIEAEMDGRKLDASHVVGTLVLLLLAGIDDVERHRCLAVAPGERRPTASAWSPSPS